MKENTRRDGCNPGLTGAEDEDDEVAVEVHRLVNARALTAMVVHRLTMEDIINSESRVGCPSVVSSVPIDRRWAPLG
tara:strand:+ start:208 stop:438 length:231 start_codon:yes stop_codon:yes gene_type:complete